MWLHAVCVMERRRVCEGGSLTHSQNPPPHTHTHTHTHAPPNTQTHTLTYPVFHKEAHLSQDHKHMIVNSTHRINCKHRRLWAEWNGFTTASRCWKIMYNRGVLLNVICSRHIRCNSSVQQCCGVNNNNKGREREKQRCSV